MWKQHYTVTQEDTKNLPTDSCADATKIFQDKLNDMKEELDDAKEELKDMKKELNDTREELDKATDSCPGEGIYMVPCAHIVYSVIPYYQV